MYKSRYNSTINLHLLITQRQQIPTYRQFYFGYSLLPFLITLSPHWNMLKQILIYIISFINIPHVNLTDEDLKT